LAAALSYYALFSVTPILLISIALAGMVFGEEAARGEVLATVRDVVGETAGRGIEQLILNARQEREGGIFATIVALALLLFGASGVFNQLKDALNTIWDAAPQKKGGLLRLVRQRFLSFAMVLVVGFLLLVSLVISAALAAAGKYLEGFLPGNATVWQFVNLAVSLVVITVLFAMIFRYVPDRRIPWNEVWLGAAFTSVLFTLGKTFIGLYLGRGTIASAYGAAGSVVVILIWIYYSSMIVFFGAEFTEVYSRRRSQGAVQPRQRAGLAAVQPLRPIVMPAETKRTRGGRVAPVATGCIGLLIGLLLGIISAVLGVLVTAVTTAAKKLWK